MPTGFGRTSYIGWVEEDPYGTLVTPPTKWAELIGEDIRTIRTRTPRPVFRGLDVAETDLYDEKEGAEGTFTFELNYNDALRLLEHALGVGATVNEEVAIRDAHTFTLTDPLMTDKGLTFYVNKGVDEYQVSGCKISNVRWTFDPARNGQMEVTIVGQNVIGVAPTAPTFPNVARYIAGHQATVEIDTVARNFDSLEITLNNALDIDKRILGSKSIDQPVRGDSRREITAILRVDALDTDWDNFRAGTEFQLEVNHVGPVLGNDTFRAEWNMLKCKHMTDPIRLESPGIIKAEWDVKILKPTAGEMLSIVFASDESVIA